MKDSEGKLADILIGAFESLASCEAVTQLTDIGSIDLVNDVFGQFLVDSFTDEKELGQYLTPPEIVRFMVKLGLESMSGRHLDALLSLDASSPPGVVLDPSCGVGSFLAETMKALYSRVRSEYSPRELSRWVKTMMTQHIVGIDKSERMVRLALANLALFGAPSVNLHLANSLDRSRGDAKMTRELEGRAFLILTNPPFGAEFSRHDLSEYRIASSWSGSNGSTIDSEILFMERYIEWLAPDGVLVAVVPDSVLTNRGVFEDLRTGISPHVEILSVVSLPSVTFAAAGTNTKTSILHLRKTPTKKSRSERVYFGVCEDVGFEVSKRGNQRTRITTGRGQLPEMLEEATGRRQLTIGLRKVLVHGDPRWDATFHASLPQEIQERLENPGLDDIRVSHVAELVNNRTNPTRLAAAEFEMF